MDKKSLITIGVTAAGVLAGIFIWRGLVRPNAPAGVIGARSNL